MSDTAEKLIQPLPWAVQPSLEPDSANTSLVDHNGFTVFGGVTRDEAEFIVRCVNHHAELVAALESLCQWGDEREERKYPDAYRPWTAARAVLAKVK